MSEPSGIKCPNCAATASRVVRSEPRAGFVWRRRECLRCRSRFTTTENRPGGRFPVDVPVTIGQLLESLHLLGLQEASTPYTEDEHGETRS
jgi:hypothetical protein